MISFPNAKINLGLYITGKRPDGFHNIESIFLPVALSDALEVIPAPAGTATLEVSGIPVEASMQDNICMKAFALLRDKIGDRGMSAYLFKHIPTGAGLGGGSSDGAIMLKLLDEVYALNLSPADLESLAARLGSDCPFFLKNQACFVTGRGEEITPIHMDLKDKYVVIVNPGIHVSTVQAYGLVTPKPAGFDLRKISTLPLEQWHSEISNDFEEPVARLHPVVDSIKQKLYDEGAVYASMSGSGSSLFGIFNSQANLEAKFPEQYYWEGRFL